MTTGIAFSGGRRIGALLVANRGEIAIRVMRAATELGIRTIAVYSAEDRFALHRWKADESYPLDSAHGPVKAYLDIEGLLRVAREAGADAVHPGYGFLSESPEFAAACAAAGLVFVGPPPAVMQTLGNKVQARALAEQAGVPVMPATGPLPGEPAAIAALADAIGYPLMLKASRGGGGRGMRVIRSPADLATHVAAGRREAQAAFGDDEVYLEKLLRHARHVEVQLLGDAAGGLVHLYERDCTVQRRHQKVVERAPAPCLDATQRQALCDAALRLGRAAGYRNAGTVEFLQDIDSGDFYFIEVNPRIQVEHTVTECVTGIDIVKAQIRIAAGARLDDPASGVPPQAEIRPGAHALQCRVTTEDPENNFIPDYGRIRAYRSAAGFGIRLDAGTAYSGALITPYYDSLLVKVTAWGPDPDEAIVRMNRALQEFRVRGLATNLRFLETLINHPDFRAARYNTRFVDETPALLKFPRRRDRATRLLRFVGDVIVNGNPLVAGRARPARLPPPSVPAIPDRGVPPPGSRQRLEALGPKAFAAWMRDQDALLITDTTMRDAHQSLFATRMRSHDMVQIAPAYAHRLPQLFSVECWGGATFDVAMRFLHECPWERLASLRAAMPNVLLQMLLRASNAVGYTNYPDNAVRYFVQRAAATGIDLFRIFDSLNWVENMRVAMDAVLESGKLCEAAICYTGDIDDPARSKYDLDYYLDMARALERAGAHILGIKDMAGVCRPAAARRLVTALKQEIGLPVHFHTHDTSGIAAASVLAAAEAGADAADAAMDSMSGLTSQPNLGALVAALARTPRDTGLDPAALRRIADYWEAVRHAYQPFESDTRSGTSEVYLHEMPGGQYTNLREQARALGLDHRWHEVAAAYAAVNRMFGDIVKVTPTSMVVGDMALMMVANDLTPEDVQAPEREIAFPESVVALFRGDLGQPPGGFPEALRHKVMRGAPADRARPGARLPPVDLEATRASVQRKIHRQVTDNELASFLMYPKVFTDHARHHSRFGDVSALPTPVFFYGMEAGQEVSVRLERGKTLIIRFLALSDPDDKGQRTVFFELNGQPRAVQVDDRSIAGHGQSHPRADPDNPGHIAAPMPGMVVTVSVQPGQKVARGSPLVALEAMKMETAVRAEQDGVVDTVLVRPGTRVEAHDLLLTLADKTPA